MNGKSPHLVVEQGPDKGLEITIPQNGARAGRSFNNDIVLKDPAMSRFHCRFFFKEGDGLWAEDLGSANQTMLNNKPLREARLHVNDRLIMGDTTIKVLADSPTQPPHQPLFDKSPEAKAAPAIDILRPPKKKSQNQRRSVALLTLAVIMALAATATWVLKELNRPRVAAAKASVDSQPRELEISYEKIQAGPDNIFRYEMELRNNELSIQVDDLKNQRHVAKNQRKRVDADLVHALLDNIEHSGFFDLQQEYKGRSSSVWEVFDLTVTVGPRTRRVVVENRIEPNEFKNAREVIEEFGRNELGLAALELSHEKLTELAGNAWLLAQSLYDQRQIKNENLALAIRSLKEMEWYLETIEPKPDYYPAAIALLGECERELQEAHDHHLFLADRAIRLRDWPEAANQLRILCERIPDRSDERHKNARKKLIDVERRLKKG